MATRHRTVVVGLAAAGLAVLGITPPATAHTVATPRPIAVTRLSAAERAAVERARPRPPRVTDLAPYKDGSTVTLGWHNPDPALFRRDVVRYVRGATAPRTPRDGAVVTLGRRRATTATLTELTAGRRYTAAVWVRDAMGRLSPRDATTFVAPMESSPSRAAITGRITDKNGEPL